MILLKKASATSTYLQDIAAETGFIPTMGALHEGHIALLKQAKEEGKFTVCSIFVNPTQFNNSQDFEKYPSTIDRDIDLLEAAGCDVLFLPTVDEMYPNGLVPKMHYDLGYLETVLEGKYRPGHFQGVCQVVHRLLEIVMPGTLYLGQKDYQQCMVIKKLLSLLNWQNKISLQICATVREADGLAMSSRNRRLDAVSREKAVRISETLNFINREIKPGYLNDLKMRCANYLAAEGFKVDYVEIASAADLSIDDTWDGKQQLVALAAAFSGEVRLIDNMLIPQPASSRPFP
jgi:pantoate--beta-alanine ligase